MLNIILTAYIIDKNDISEAKMAYEWINHLSAHVKLTVITSGSRINEKTGLENNTNINLIILPPAINYKRFDKIDRAAHPGYFEFCYKAQKNIKKLLQASDYDIGHHLTPQAIRFPSPFRHNSIPYILGPIHGGLPYSKKVLEIINKKKSLINLYQLDKFRMNFDFALKNSYKNASKVLISAPYVKDIIPDFGNIETLSGVAINRNQQRPISNSSKMKICCASRLVPIKGIELLLKGFEQCKCQKDVELHFYGKGPFEDKYKQLSSKFSYPDNIFWHGFVSNDKVINAMKTMDVFALPSLREPAGIAVLEAMATGLPIICIDEGGPMYNIKNDCGIKISLTTKDEIIKRISDAIDLLYNNKEKRVSMGRAGIDNIECNFTWDAVTKKMLNIYSSILSENK